LLDLAERYQTTRLFQGLSGHRIETIMYMPLILRRRFSFANKSLLMPRVARAQSLIRSIHPTGTLNYGLCTCYGRL